MSAMREKMHVCHGCILAAFLSLLAGCGVLRIFQGECASLGEWASAPFKHVTVLTWNLHAGRGLDGTNGIARAAAVIKDSGAHVVALQEIDRDTARSGHVDQLAELERLTGYRATWCKTLDFDGGEYGIALLSKDEPASVRTISLPGAAEARKALLAEFPEYNVLVTHLSLDEAERQASIPLLRSAFTAEKPLFLAGDLNDTPNSPFIQALRGPFALLSRTTPTFPADHPVKCLDYVAVSRRHRTRYEKVTAEVLDVPAVSDHRPVRVTCR